AQQAGAADARPEEAWFGQRQAVRNELGWIDPSDAHDRILARLEPVALAVRRCVHAADGDGPAADVGAELALFEAWFERERGTSFYALFDQYFPEVPVVDF
ncbi:MAG: hypothetical protein J2P50_07685, partial [Hyphomicrobiaceae bacterium]|nr:hypothetical protein [Hyphomicrobiaceae bacterium]